MAERIKRKPAELRDQLSEAIAGIDGEGAWPGAPAPTKGVVTSAQATLAAAIIAADAAEAAWKIANQTRQTAVDAGFAIMQRVDQVTDGLYGPSGAQKSNFGLVPKGAAIAGLHKLATIVVQDGLISGSLRFDWESIEGATYEVQWFSDSGLTTMIGSATTTASEYMISGLTPGTQYWMHVRPHRGGQTAPWSDPATRVAPV